MRKYLHQRRNSILTAWSGLILFFKTEVHAIIHLLVAACVIIGGWFFSVTSTEWIALILAIALVIQAEIWNTVLEKVSDFIQPEMDKRIKVIKDLAASAVLWCVLSAGVIGLIIFVPYAVDWLRTR